MKDPIRKLTSLVQNQRGVAIIGAYLIAFLLSAVAAASYSRSIMQSRSVDREVARVQSFAAAEAAIQSALAQIGQNAYTGYINTASISSNLQSVYGTNTGTYSASVSYPNSADWVVVSAIGTNQNESHRLEARIFLNSNLSKYLIFANTPLLSLGDNLVLGSNNGVDPQGVPADPNDRAATYHTQDLDFSGSNIHVYGDMNAERLIDGSVNSYVHGDTYAGNFRLNADGSVADDGINGSLTVTDGFNDDIDRNRDGRIDGSDYVDRHDLTSTGGSDSHSIETLDDVDTTFYKNHKDPNLPATWGTNSSSRYIEFAPSADNTKTKIIEYSNNAYSVITGIYTLSSSNAIVYNNGRIYVKGGQILGRVSVVAADDISFDGNVRYKSNASYCDTTNSAAFIAKDKVYMRATSLEVSGIVYARKGGSADSLAIDADYDTTGNFNPGPKASGHFRLFGNVIMNGTGNTSDYSTDRAYVYDQNLKYYRPPGIPVRPELRTVREA